MPNWSGILNIFGTGRGKNKKESPEAINTEKLFVLLKSLISREDLIADYWKTYNEIKNLPKKEQPVKYLVLYLNLEDFISGNKPPIIKEELTRIKIREYVRKKIDIDFLNNMLQVFFLPEIEQNIRILELGSRVLIDYIIVNLGLPYFQKLLATVGEKSPLRQIYTESGTTNFEKLREVSKELKVAEINFFYRSLFRAVYDEIGHLFGKDTAEKLMRSSYAQIKYYSPDLLAKYFDVIPEEALQLERLSVLSREELEKQVREKTKELGEAFDRLEEAKKGVDREVIKKTREVQEEQARLLASINSLTQGFIINRGKEIVLKNEAVGSILGLKGDFTFADIVERLGTNFDIGAQTLACAKEKKSIEANRVTLGGRYLRIFLSPVAIVLPSEDVVDVVILIEDITEQTLLEQKKDEFFAITSHEMRTPLTIIRGEAELVLDSFDKNKGADEGGLREMVTSIHTNTKRLMNIVNDFLDISLLEGGRLKLKKERFDTVELIKEILSILEKEAAKKKLYMRLELPGKLPAVIGDRDRTHQVVVNIVSNALQYTEKGGLTIKFEKEGSFIKVYFNDTGVGIEPERQSSLFQKFQIIGERLMNSREYGSGLGLYIARLIVEAMGGKIKLEKSVVGVGSSFSITLPTSPK